jgi:hypothetical protein
LCLSIVFCRNLRLTDRTVCDGVDIEYASRPSSDPGITDECDREEAAEKTRTLNINHDSGEQDLSFVERVYDTMKDFLSRSFTASGIVGGNPEPRCAVSGWF